jgi:hypothetical protein
MEEGTDWEHGYLALGNGVSEGTRTVLRSSNSDNPINLGGTATLTCILLAEDVQPGRHGMATLDFGAWPGSPNASIVITGQSGIGANAKVRVWVQPAATPDHSADEHWVDPPEVFAGNIVPGTGFTIYAMSRQRTVTDRKWHGYSTYRQAKADMPYGQWNVGWSWHN